MDEDLDYLKLSSEEKCQHKLWKARVIGYTEIENHFGQQTDRNSHEFSKYFSIIKNAVTDNHVLAQEKGLSAVLSFVENAACASNICEDVINGIINKCLGSSKEKIKDLSFSIIYMYIEIEKQDIVRFELMKGVENKSPKIVAACVKAITVSLNCFGPKVIHLKPIIKKLGKLLEDRDKIVRENTKLLTIEMYRWMKEALKPHLSNLKEIHLKELYFEFLKVKDDIPQETRQLRSKQVVKPTITSLPIQENEAIASEAEVVDSFDILEEVDIFPKVTKELLDNCEAKKWQDRKESLETLIKLVTNVRLVVGDYSEIIRILKRIISKDSNIMVSTLGAKCLTLMALALQKQFIPHAGYCIPILLDKFKEKKQSVLQVLRECIDTIFKFLSLDFILPDIKASLENKNPQIKLETIMFLIRCFQKCNQSSLTKKLLKPLCASLRKTLDDTDPSVRDASAEALGTLLKIVGEKSINPFLQDVDPLKMSKIKEVAEGSSSSNTSGQAPSLKKAIPKNKPTVSKDKEIKQSKPESTLKKELAKLSGKPRPQPSNSQFNNQDNLQQTFSFTEKYLGEEEVIDILNEIGNQEEIAKITNSNWKYRLSSVDHLKEMAKEPNNTLPTQAFIKFLTLNKGLKENNPQVMKGKLELINMVVEKGQISRHSIESCLYDVIEKIGDPKVELLVFKILNAFTKASNLDYVSQEIMRHVFSANNHKNQTESLVWLTNAINEFGLKMPIPSAIAHLKKAFASTNPSVKTAAINLLCALHPHVGASLMGHFADLKPALLKQIGLELAKNQIQKPSLLASLGSTPPASLGEGGDAKVANSHRSENPEYKICKAGSGTNSKEEKSKVGDALAMPSAKQVPSSKRPNTKENISPQLTNNNMKEHRFINERVHKTLRWNFIAPGDEHYQQLKTEMTEAGWGQMLVSYCFHVDCKFHIKAMDIMSKYLADSAKVACTQSNVDLILKWHTLKFFETNPAVLARSVAYLQELVGALSKSNYRLLEQEATSFIPYLINKVINPKEPSKDAAKIVFERLQEVYPASNIFAFLMHALSSNRNSKQKAEFLEAIGLMISSCGIFVGQQTPGFTLREIAKHISDQDPAVRNAALNCIEIAHRIEGDNVFAYLESIPQKIKVLIKERIRKIQSDAHLENLMEDSRIPEETSSQPRDDNTSERLECSNITKKLETKSFSSNKIQTQNTKELFEAILSRCQNSENESLDSKILPERSVLHEFQIVKNESENSLAAPETSSKSLHEKIPSQYISLKGESNDNIILMSTLKKDDAIEQMKIDQISTNLLDLKLSTATTKICASSVNEPPTDNNTTAIDITISYLADENLHVAISAFKELRGHLKGNPNLMKEKIDSIISMASFQFSLIQTNHSLDSQLNKKNILELYRSIIKTLFDIFDNRNLASCVGKDILKDFLLSLFSLILDDEPCDVEEHSRMVKVINVLMFRILETANPTHTLITLLEVLHTQLRGSSPSEKSLDLILTCLLRMVKTFDQFIGSLDIKAFLLSVHLFLKVFPSSFWKKQPSDNHLKAIRTLLFKVIQHKEMEVSENLENIPNVHESELRPYVSRLIKKANLAKVNLKSTEA